MGINATFAFEPSYCLCAACPFLTLSFSENDLCLKPSVLVSEEGALHNRQIWPEAPRATKLLSPRITMMWNNLVFRLWCFPSPCYVLLLSYHLSYPQLTSKCAGSQEL